jgi:hypothetical protein
VSQPKILVEKRRATPASPCPECGVLLASANPIRLIEGDDRNSRTYPLEGDATICFDCGTTLIYCVGGSLLKASEEQIEEWKVTAPGKYDLLHQALGMIAEQKKRPMCLFGTCPHCRSSIAVHGREGSINPGDHLQCGNCSALLELDIGKRLVTARTDSPGVVRVLESSPVSDHRTELTDWMTAQARRGHVVRMLNSNNTSGAEVFNWEQLHRMAASGDYFILTAMLVRPGMVAATHAIEVELFPAASPLNDLLEVFYCDWQNEPFQIVFVPASKRPEVEALLKKRGLRAANGVPTFFGRGPSKVAASSRVEGPGTFPLNYPAVFNLEPITERGSVTARVVPASSPDSAKELIAAGVRGRGLTGAVVSKPTPGQIIERITGQFSAETEAFGLPTPQRIAYYLRKYSAKYPDCWKRVEEMRSGRAANDPSWPPWCFFPIKQSYLLLKTYIKKFALGDVNDIGVVAALATWRMTRGVYRFDETVYSEVTHTPAEGKLPVDVFFHLPEWCMYVETPGARFSEWELAGFFAHLDRSSSEPLGCDSLRLVLDTDHGLVSIPIHLIEEGLEAGMKSAILWGKQTTSERGLPDIFGDSSEVARLASGSLMDVGPLVNLLLYLCSVNSDISDGRGTDRRPSNPKPRRIKQGRKLFPAEGDSIWQVGYVMGAAIRRGARGEPGPSEPAERTPGHHASPRPHMRRAHWHTFLKGPRKPRDGEARTQFIKWLPPKLVNEAKGEAITTVRRVE